MNEAMSQTIHRMYLVSVNTVVGYDYYEKELGKTFLAD